MIIKAKKENNSYSILLEKKLFDNAFNSFLVDAKNNIICFVDKHTKYNISTIIQSLKSNGYKITIEKSKSFN